VRLELPEELRNHIDSAAPDMVKAYMSTIASAAGETDYGTAVTAAQMVFRSTGQLRKTDVAVYAARLYGDGPVPYDEPVDLTEYDAVFGGSLVVN
jgi:hypothetical protein